MSNYLAIATVSAALRQVISDAVTADVPTADTKVTHVRPGGEPAATPTTGVNVYLYAVTPNAALRNGDLPTRRGDGSPVRKPEAAIDLHYLLTFYGDDAELETHRLLGSVVRTLHAAPTLPRDKLREAVTHLTWLAGSDMADSVQAVRLTPVSLSLEELSKLWSILFQTPYALSAAYRASVVLIEGEESPMAALPVRERTVVAAPFRQPVVERVENAGGAGEPIVATSTLVLTGRGLRGDVTRVHVGVAGAEATPTELRDTRIVVPLASVPASGLRAGVQGIGVVHERLLGIPPAPHAGPQSNVAAFVLRPVVDAVAHAPAPDPEHPATVSVTLSPTVGKTQRAVLLLNELGGARAHSFAAARRNADAKTITFAIDDVDAATYLVRVQVDGAESPLVADAAGAITQPQVVIP
jgi:hypothetical protein